MEKEKFLKRVQDELYKNGLEGVYLDAVVDDVKTQLHKWEVEDFSKVELSVDHEWHCVYEDEWDGEMGNTTVAIFLKYKQHTFIASIVQHDATNNWWDYEGDDEEEHFYEYAC